MYQSSTHYHPNQQVQNHQNNKRSFSQFQHRIFLVHQAFSYINQIGLTFNLIPTIFKYTLPFIVLTINILQLPCVNVINFNSLSMDPAQVFGREGFQWWRFWSYLLAIDIGGGFWELGRNLGLVIVLGYAVATVCQGKHGKQMDKKEKVTIGKQINETELTEKQIASLETEKPLKQNLLKYWIFILLIEMPIFTLILSLINCFIWFVWTSFGPHTFVSSGILPLAYFYFCYRRAISDKKVLGIFHLRISGFVQNILIGIVLMVFSMQAQSILIITIYGLLKQMIISYHNCRKSNSEL